MAVVVGVTDACVAAVVVRCGITVFFVVGVAAPVV